MAFLLGVLSPIRSAARHLQNLAPCRLYALHSASRLSSPFVLVSPSQPSRGARPCKMTVDEAPAQASVAKSQLVLFTCNPGWMLQHAWSTLMPGRTACLVRQSTKGMS